MAKRRPPSSAAVSLFPFLSILACIMGALTLILAGVVLGQMEEEGDSEQRHQRIKDEITSVKEQIKKLDTQLDQAIGGERVLTERVTNAPSSVKLSPEEMKELLPALRKKTELQKEIQRLKADLERLEALLRDLKTKVTLRKEGVIRLVPEMGGLGKGLQPSCWECTSDGILIHPLGTRIATSAISGNAFRDQVDSIRQRGNWSIVFLVRPTNEAITVFTQAEGRMKQLGYQDYGYVPLPSMAALDLGSNSGK